MVYELFEEVGVCCGNVQRYGCEYLLFIVRTN